MLLPIIVGRGSSNYHGQWDQQMVGRGDRRGRFTIIIFLFFHADITLTNQANFEKIKIFYKVLEKRCWSGNLHFSLNQDCAWTICEIDKVVLFQWIFLLAFSYISLELFWERQGGGQLLGRLNPIKKSIDCGEGWGNSNE